AIGEMPVLPGTAARDAARVARREREREFRSDLLTRVHVREEHPLVEVGREQRSGRADLDHRHARYARSMSRAFCGMSEAEKLTDGAVEVPETLWTSERRLTW